MASQEPQFSGHRAYPPETVPGPSPTAPPRAARAVTLRAVLLGLALVPLLCWWTLKHELIHGGTEFVEASLVVIAVFTLFLLVLLNELLRRQAPRLVFSQGELLTVYVMLTTSLGIAGLGGMQILPQELGAAFYFASPENGWADLHPMIARWLVPDPSVLEEFYKGNSSFFTREHLLGWAAPMVAWSAFILALLGVMFCLNVMIRQPWIEHERLTFPLVYLPLELTREAPPGPHSLGGGGGAAMLRSRSFWAAFVLVCIFRSITGLHNVVPGFPDLAEFDEEGQSFPLDEIFVSPPWNAIGYSRLSFHPLVVGITYFLPAEIAFSAWFFYLLVKAEQILAAAYGWEPAGGGSMAHPPYVGEQGAGAFLVIALLSLLHARHHLAAVWRKALRGDPSVDDRREPLSYRAAVFGFLAGSAFLVFFMVAARMSWHLAALFFTVYFLYVLTATRLRAEAGTMLLYSPDVSPHRLIVDVAGTRHWSAQNLTSLTYLQWFDLDYRTVAMPQQLEALKIADSARIAPRRLTPLIFAATALAAVASFVAILAIYYHYGATTPRGGNSWRLEQGLLPFETLSNWLYNPTDTDWTSIQWIGIGGGVTAALVHLRTRFLWWPFHPSGYVLAHAGLAMTWVWFPMLMGWALKSVVLRYGGMKLYRAWIPFFLGLILGDIGIGVIWALIGAALNMNVYLFFPG
jgi:hypothetical protein